jgi:signal transduction histidine kinase
LARAKDLETCLRVLAQGSRSLVEERDLDRLSTLAVDVATRLTGAAGAVVEAGGARAALGLTVDPERGCVLRVPVVVGGESWGFVAVIAPAGHAFDDSDELLLLTVASQIAAACSVIRASEDARSTETRHRLEALEKEEQRHDSERLREVQTMEAIGRLAGGVAHDFNNQLSIILSYASMIKDGLLLADPLRDEVELIERAGHRARDLTRQLLAVGRRQVLRPQLVDLSEIVGRLAEAAKVQAGDRVEITVQFSGPCMVRIDPNEVEQAIAAVVTNALEAMPGGGKLSLEVLAVQAGEAFCRRHVGLNPGAYWGVVVTDTGTGMDATTLSRAFEPFFSTKESGRGLGLSTVFGVMHQSGGTVWVESKPGQGSAFHLCLRQAASSEPPRRTSSFAPPSSDAQTILVVEDDPQVRRLTAGILKRLGFRVLEAPDGVLGLHVAAEFAGPIHLLVTDVIMPQMGGRELAERLSVVRPDTRILFVSGYTDDVVLREGIRNSGVAFLPKPFTAEALTQMVRGVLDAPS